MLDRVPLIGLEGHAKIELFDYRTGMREKVVEGHNLFTEYGLNRYRRLCALMIGGQFGANLWFDEAASHDITLRDSAGLGILSYLYLTDNDAAVSASQSLVPGNVTGYASRVTYTGVDALRGSLNQSETSFTPSGLKAVFDFGTDKANGTHKSVFWTDRPPTEYGFMYFLEDSGISAPLKRAYDRITQSDDGYFYGAVSNKIYKINPTTMEEIADYTAPAALYYQDIFDVVGGKSYFNSYGGTTLNIFDLETSTNTTKALTGYGPKNGCVIGNYCYYIRSSNNVGRINLTTGALELKTPSPQIAICDVLRCGSTIYLLTTNPVNNIYSYNWDTNTATAVGYYGIDSRYIGNSNAANNLWVNQSIPSYYNGNSQLTKYILKKLNPTGVNKGNMITAKVLDSPVVKNNTQTMKVTYTISFT